ncbi:hypothetical protein Csa_019785 [Cucumis sativus]|nr:hypothetical protein Csa_019785 [Cucumis sativus]
MGSSSVNGAESSSSCSSNSKWSYDVFLSFRGEDTRDKFISHLDLALRREGVNFFIDDKLDRGKQISKSLLKSIEGSRISIIIFSQNYASSTWCLDEVVKIIECMRSKKQTVLPVFYNVSPSEVVKQTGIFGEAFAKYETNPLMTNKIQPWKEALTTAATLSAKHPVAIDSQLKAIEELASHGVSDNGVNMVGIHGMGGIGKTTLAKALYNKITYQFEACCFLSNVRETSEQFNGLVQLQEKLLNEIFKDNNLKVDNVDKGMNIIKDRLCSRKVLMVLDDVDKDDQLDALVGGRDWFGRGSKIIVTTRDRHLLETYSFDKIHPIQLLDCDKSLELFCWHAFKQSHPSRNYSELPELVRYCNGLPLALVILGSLLCKRDQIIWKSKLDELKNFPEPGIEAVFQISFKRLPENPPVKEIFLDICCFFVGEDVSYSKNVLKACDPYLESRIIILMDLSLVTVEDGKIQMHDLIRQMGQMIVRRKSFKPEKRSRLWVAKEAVKMLIEKSGTHKVKAIKLDLRNNGSLIVEAEAFRNMENLRLLILQNAAKLPTNIFKYLPNIKWIEYSSSSVRWYFPISFVVNGGLVGLVINGVSNKHPGIIFEDCKMLKHVDLSYWRLLEETPDFSAALNLEKLYLLSCKRLKMIHGSVASLSKLVTLDLEGCENLEKLPSSFLMLKSLEVLNLSGCIKLKEIPDLSASSNLKELHLRECYHLRIIHDSAVGRFLDKLVILDLEGCKILERLPRYISNSKSIEVMNLDSCRKIEQLFDNYFEKFPSHLKFESLKVLNLSYCQNLKEITDFSIASNLEIFDLRGCFSLRTIHKSVGSLDQLIALKLDFCHQLEELPSCLRLKSLDSLSLTNCYKIEQLPEFDENMKSLREMNLKGTAIRKLPTSIRYLIGLENLILSYCTNLISLPSEIHLLKSLKELDLRECSRLDMLPSGSSLNFPQRSLCSNLTILDLQNCNISNSDFLENLSNFCTTLKELNLSGNKFCCLPSLKNFTSLRLLELRNCKFLRNIVKIPHCLKRMDASGCELLVISPDYIADMMFRNQDLKLRNFKRELIVTYSEIPKFCNNQTTESSISFSFQHNSDMIIPALVVCVVFKVDADSFVAEAFIHFQVLFDGQKLMMPTMESWCGSKSEHMLLLRTPPSQLICLNENNRHKIEVSFQVRNYNKKAKVIIRSLGVYVVDDLFEHYK